MIIIIMKIDFSANHDTFFSESTRCMMHRTRSSIFFFPTQIRFIVLCVCKPCCPARDVLTQTQHTKGRGKKFGHIDLAAGCD